MSDNNVKLYKYVITVKVGNNGIAVTVRDAETGRVASFTITPRDVGGEFLREIETRLGAEIKYE